MIFLYIYSAAIKSTIKKEQTCIFSTFLLLQVENIREVKQRSGSHSAFHPKSVQWGLFYVRAADQSSRFTQELLLYTFIG